ncbi:MAG: efflux RND transporter periplasmic adaptor subunit [Candidatus Paceibacterota bacterium]|jgi:multidrug efflux pump subunit AcrA (membrane-fusion protein)
MSFFLRYFNLIKTFSVRRPWVTAIIVIVTLFVGYSVYKNVTEVPVVNYATVEKGTVSQIVSVTGKVKPAEDVNLSFEKGGRVIAVYRDVGEHVYAGEPIAAVSSADISAQLEGAKATVRVEQARLDELKSGTRPEDIYVSQVDVDSATSDVINDIKNGYVNADDAIRNKVDQLMSNPKSTNPQLNFILSDSQLKSDIESGRLQMEAMLTSWNSSVIKISISSDVIPYSSEAKNNLKAIQLYLDKIALAVNGLSASSALTQTTIDSYKSAVVLARTNVTTALSALTSASENLISSRSKLALKQAGSIPEKISAQEAALEVARANVSNLESQLAKTVVYSPISGVITKQDSKVGEIASPSVVLISVISDSQYEIEANVPEADISKINKGNKAEVTLDAYGSDVIFMATLSTIDPAETIIDGVATYKTTLSFDKSDSRIKSGMTANTDIFGAKKENVLFVQGRAISTKDKIKTVKLIEGEETREVTVTTGLRGSNGDVEILSGLKEGDRIKMN